jgi:hypothetical protein
MADPTRADQELGKFSLSTGNDVCWDVEVVTLDPLNEPVWTVADLELKKFNSSWQIRVVLTI